MRHPTLGRVFSTARLLGVVTALAGACVTQHAVAQTNVVVIISDDAGWADFGFMDQVTGGNTPIVTPNLDALANSGVILTNAYTGAVCSVSRASIATGQYGSRFGYEDNIPSSTAVIGTVQTAGLPVEVKTTFEYMQEQGYTTGVVGKWHLGAHQDSVSGGTLVLPGNRPAQQGVDEFFGLLGGGRNYFVGSQTGDGALATETLNPNGTVNHTVVESQYSGQYVTDLLGQKSADFIEAHAGDENPFFLYHSFTSPHTPVTTANVLTSDYNDPRIAGITNTNRRILAANMLAMDRAVGTILDALDDPNGDGNTADSIRDDTMVIFINDNGGDCCDTNGTNYANNGPLQNGKGTGWEGGIRVPMIIAGAGVDPSKAGTLYNAPVHAIDITATAFESAAGGTFAPGTVMDGVNLIPYINGTATGDPHASILSRRPGGGQVSVRAGDWKLYHRDTQGFLLFDVVNDPGEANNRAGDFPQMVEDLKRVMTDWEVQMDKNRVDNASTTVNQFNSFRFREGAFASASFSTVDAWIDANNGASGNKTMSDLDSFSGMELVFRNRNSGNWTLTNDMTRNSGLEFMASTITMIDRNETQTGNGIGTITGLPILLAKNALNGNMPTLALSATITGPNTFTYDLALSLKLYDDLTITGNGDQPFVVSGDIVEYREGRSITKTGTSTVSLTGDNALTGTISVQQGRLIAGGQASLGEADLHVESGATLEVATAYTLGSNQQLTGTGTFKTAELTNEGEVSPGNSPGQLTIEGDYTQDSSGLLTLEINGLAPGSQHDQLIVTGDVTLAGTLTLVFGPGYVPLDGDAFTIITAASISGTFDNFPSDVLGNGMVLTPIYNATSVVVHVLDETNYADLDHDGDVDDADFGIAFAAFTGPNNGPSSNPAADFDQDGDVDDADFGLAFAAFTGPGSGTNVPEPTSLALLGLLSASCAARRRPGRRSFRVK